MATIFLLASSLLAAPKENPKKRFQPVGPIELTKEGERWAEKTLRSMSVEQKVGQLLMVRGLAEFENVESEPYQKLRDDLHRFHLGSILLTVRTDGPFLLRNQPYEAAMMTNRLQAEADFPLLFAADFERGLSMRLLATPMFPHAMAFGAAQRPELVQKFAEVSARESRAIGVHWNFFPVADVNSNPLNPIINIRSFGEDAQAVAALTGAYIRSARIAGMMVTAKHFPGHGDTDSDSHLAVSRVNSSLEHLRSTELPPFQAAIDAGVDAVMIAHVTVPALEPDTNKVATISHKVITDLLIKEMTFSGLVVTDAMDMQGLTRIYPGPPQASAGRAAVDALLAGNDMILLPSELEGAYNGMLAAAKSGEIPAEELDSRVRKVLQFKAGVGLHKSRFVDVDAMAATVGRPADMVLAQDVADAAVTLVRDDSPALALLRQERARQAGTSAPGAAYQKEGPVTSGGAVVLIFTDDIRSDWGRAFEREMRTRLKDAEIVFLDPRISASMTEAVTAAVLNARVVVVAAYAIPSAGRTVRQRDTGSVALDSDAGALMDRVLKIGVAKTAVVAMGNPYLAKDFPDVQTYLCTFSHVPTSELAAVKALFGEMAIHGKLPVTIPGVAERGAGIERGVESARERGRAVRLRPASYRR